MTTDVINLPEDIEISKGFDIVDLFEYHEDVPIHPGCNPRLSSFEEKGTDVGQGS